MLAVRRARDRGPVPPAHARKQLRTHDVERWQRAIVDERPSAVYEWMGVFQGRLSHRGAADVREHGGRVDARGGAPEVFAMVSRPRLPLDVGRMVLIGGHTPSVRMAIALQVLAALRHQRVLGVDQGAFDFRRLIGAKCVKPAHVVTSRGRPRRRPEAPSWRM